MASVDEAQAVQDHALRELAAGWVSLLEQVKIAWPRWANSKVIEIVSRESTVTRGKSSAELSRLKSDVDKVIVHAGELTEDYYASISPDKVHDKTNASIRGQVLTGFSNGQREQGKDLFLWLRNAGYRTRHGSQYGNQTWDAVEISFDSGTMANLHQYAVLYDAAAASMRALRSAKVKQDEDNAADLWNKA